MQTVSAHNGRAYNGVTVGGGFDVTIKRASSTTAIVCVTEVSSRQEWLTEIGIDDGTDLQLQAVLIAQCPQVYEMASESSDEWDRLAETWDSIG